MSGGRESSLVHMAAAIETVLRHLGAAEAVIGHSLGGAAASYAMALGAPVKKAVLLAPAADIVGHTRRFARHLGLPEGIRALMQAQIERHFGIHWSEFEVERVARLVATHGLGHSGALRDSAVIHEVAAFIGSATELGR